jgi:hypothetical protein
MALPLQSPKSAGSVTSPTSADSTSPEMWELRRLRRPQSNPPFTWQIYEPGQFLSVADLTSVKTHIKAEEFFLDLLFKKRDRAEKFVKETDVQKYIKEENLENGFVKLVIGINVLDEGFAVLFQIIEGLSDKVQKDVESKEAKE